MCGINGVIHLREEKPVNRQLLEKMRDRMAHRGPDDTGLYINPNQRVGLGFRRLAIIDVSPAGHQPMQNQDGSVWIVFNGEIYNHLELRKQLEAEGQTYRSRSDTETIIYLYERYGLDFVHHLRGMFAIAIWDEKKQRLLLVRDRIGKKPLYYTTHRNQIFFASEIKVILENPEIPRAINEQGLTDYLTFFSVPAPETMFAGIYKLPAGHLAVIENGAMTINRYWDLSMQPDNEKTEEEWVATVRKELKTSVGLRNMSDVPFGAYLSGGIDSSLITVLMNELLHEPIKTFTVAFEDPEFNELEYARQIRDQFKTDYHEVTIGVDDLFAYLPKLIDSQDEPIGDWVCFPLYYVSKLIRDSGVIVAQVGEGSDELFCGYDIYMAYLKLHRVIFRHYDRLPTWLKKIGYTVIPRLPWFNRKPLLIEALRRSANNEFLFWGGAIGFTEHEKKTLLTPEFRQRTKNGYWMVKQHLDELKRALPQPDFLQQMTYLEFKHRLPELLLMRVDKVGMSTSIEARAPFLDHHFVETMAKIPSALKIKNGIPKYILKQAARGIIPDSIIDRPKKGFGAPISKWMKQPETNRRFEKMVLDSGLLRRGYLQRSVIEELFQKQREPNHPNDYGAQLWLLVNVALWYDHWIEQKS